jgi:hypothetical protein
VDRRCVGFSATAKMERERERERWESGARDRRCVPLVCRRTCERKGYENCLRFIFLRKKRKRFWTNFSKIVYSFLGKLHVSPKLPLNYQCLLKLSIVSMSSSNYHSIVNVLLQTTNCVNISTLAQFKEIMCTFLYFISPLGNNSYVFKINVILG